jgi:hypothetical protein
VTGAPADLPCPGKNAGDALTLTIATGIEHLVRHGEFYLSPEFLERWDEVLARMNAGKRGRPFQHPNSHRVDCLHSRLPPDALPPDGRFCPKTHDIHSFVQGCRLHRSLPPDPTLGSLTQRNTRDPSPRMSSSPSTAPGSGSPTGGRVDAREVDGPAWMDLGACDDRRRD